MRAFTRLWHWLPEGRALPEDVWQRRHRGVRLLLVAQSIGLLIFAVARGYPLGHSLLEASIVAFAAAVAGWQRWGRKFRATTACFGLVAASALLVHFSGGTIEAHFHFFVMLSVIALYQDWTPFLLAIGFVTVHHGSMGALDPDSVYNHPAAIAHPWTWAGIHAAFVLGASVANIVLWRMNEQARAEQTKTLSLLSATLESTADGILNTAPDGTIKATNRKFVELLRIPTVAMTSGNIVDVLPFIVDQLENPDEFLRGVQHLVDHPEAEWRDVLEFKGGRAVERFSQPEWNDGRVVGRVCSFRDVTEQHRLDEIKNSFLSAVSHELRTPLTAVLGYAVTLERMNGSMPEAERQEILGRMSANARKLQRLLTDTLDLDRLSRGIVEPRRVRTDLASLVSRAAVDPDLPAGWPIHVDAERVEIPVDPPKIERIIENLLINAIRHTPPGTPVWALVRAHDGGALIIVEDAGPGVPEDLKRSIFAAFRQGPTTPHSPGVGIGLALVARFAELHGGRAWVEDRAGGGASFRVFIPAAELEREIDLSRTPSAAVHVA